MTIDLNPFTRDEAAHAAYAPIGAAFTVTLVTVQVPLVTDSRLRRGSRGDR